jgi:glycosyltransferase involved in cell wall biosynthesis
MTLSIITVNLNNAAGLRKTIESVVSQSYSDFEFLVIDGASTDGSVEVIKEFLWKIKFWISEPDIGIYNAMNKGIRLAKGEYCLFLNSGDFLVDDNVIQSVFHQNLIEDIVVGNCYVSENGKVIFNAVSPEEITFGAFYGRTIPHQSAFIKRNLFESYGFYSEQYRILSDLDFFIRTLILNNCSYKHINVTVSDYNLEGVSSSTDTNSISKTENNEILKNLIPPRIVADYAACEKERNEMKMLYWVKNKPMIYKPLNWIFLLATFLVTLKNRIFIKY